MVFEPTSNQNLYSPHYSAILRVYDLTSERRNILFGFPSSSEKKNFFFNTKWKFSLLKIVCSTVLRLLCSYRRYKHYELINFKLQQCNYKHYKGVWLRSPFCSSFLFSKNWDETKMCWARSSNYKRRNDAEPSWIKKFFIHFSAPREGPFLTLSMRQTVFCGANDGP